MNLSARAEDASHAIGIEHQHRDIQGGAARAAVFGISDGLVSNASLVLGVAGAHPHASFVKLAGVAGLLAGALSMAAGEYISMRAQRELFERELAMERKELKDRPEAERRELALIYEERGVEPTMAAALAERMMKDPDTALATHAREELGIDPESLGSPWKASGWSLLATAVGAFVPLAAWLFTSGGLAVGLTIVLTGLVAFSVGVALSRFTGKSMMLSGGRQLLVCAVAASITYGVGTIVGVAGG